MKYMHSEWRGRLDHRLETLEMDFEQPPAGRDSSCRRAGESLKEALAAVSGTTAPRFYAVGNAHPDPARLRPMAETRRKTARTFAARLRLMEEYPSRRASRRPMRCAGKSTRSSTNASLRPRKTGSGSPKGRLGWSRTPTCPRAKHWCTSSFAANVFRCFFSVPPRLIH